MLSAKCLIFVRPQSLYIAFSISPLWRHEVETFSALLAFVRRIHRSPVDSPPKGQWRGALMFYEQKFEQTIDTPVMWDAIALILTWSLSPPSLETESHYSNFFATSGTGFSYYVHLVDSPPKGQWRGALMFYEQKFEQTIDTPVMWDAIALILTWSLSPPSLETESHYSNFFATSGTGFSYYVHLFILPFLHQQNHTKYTCIFFITLMSLIIKSQI